MSLSIMRIYRERELAKINEHVIIQRTPVAIWFNVPQIIEVFDMDFGNMINDEITPEFQRVQTTPEFLWELLAKCQEVIKLKDAEYSRDNLPINQGLEGEELEHYNNAYYEQLTQVIEDLTDIRTSHQYKHADGSLPDEDEYFYMIVR